MADHAMEWKAAIGKLTPLHKDQDRYQKVYLDGYKVKNHRYTTLLHDVTQIFDVTIKPLLMETHSADDVINVLGIGVGEGDVEILLMKRLSSYFSSTYLVAVDPSPLMIQALKRNISTIPLNFKAFEGPLSRFCAESPLAATKYQLISAVHSLYYTGDLETAFDQLTSMLSEHGRLLVVMGTADNFFRRFFKRFPFLIREVDQSLSSDHVRTVAQKKGYDVKSFKTTISIDVTSMFDDESDLGDWLTDFYTQTAHFRRGASPELLAAMKEFWRSLVFEETDGSLWASSDEELLIISKRKIILDL